MITTRVKAPRPKSPPKLTPHEAAAAILVGRIRRALDHAASVADSRVAREYLALGYDPRADPNVLDAMASDLASRGDAQCVELMLI